MKPVETAIIGVGGMARHHIHQMLKQADSTKITVVCEPNIINYQMASKIFQDAGRTIPPNQPDFYKLLKDYPFDAAFIITPHVFHFEQTKACLEAGIDVLLEKPMVMNKEEANQLISIQKKTGKLLVVAFPGSLSPEIRRARQIIQHGEIGKLLSISATVWQGWGPVTVDTWRQVPSISGGGFFFDTGAHMLNTVVDLVGEEFIEVGAWLTNYGRPVETLGVVIGRLASGCLVTLHGCGETIPSAASMIYIFGDESILRTGIWGERLDIQKNHKDNFRKVKIPKSLGVWEQFLDVRNGKIQNPCPPEVGLKMARLYDAIKASAAQNGQIVQCL